MQAASLLTEGCCDVAWQRFAVPYEYPVVFTRGALRPANPALIDALRYKEPMKRHRVLVFIDGAVLDADPQISLRFRQYAAAHADVLDLVGEPVPVMGGERVKSDPSHLDAIQQLIHEHRIDRHSFVIAIGGGAVLDAVGLAAALAHRGVRHVRMPTTVLGQNDSGVGVKNAINLNGIKNYTGAFAPPWAVVNDFDFLETLPRAQRVAGIAEAVKVALIRDRDFFEWLERNVNGLVTFERGVEEAMIRRSAELHMRQIAFGGDPFEQGSARPLDFGHWAAHRLESLTRNTVSHGEAVAIGIALDTRYSVLAGLLPEGEDERVVVLLEALGLRIFHPALRRVDASGRLALLTGLQDFREHLGGELTVTLLTSLGVGHEVNAIDDEKVVDALSWLEAREGG